MRSKSKANKKQQKAAPMRTRRSKRIAKQSKKRSPTPATVVRVQPNRQSKMRAKKIDREPIGLDSLPPEIVSTIAREIMATNNLVGDLYNLALTSRRYLSIVSDKKIWQPLAYRSTEPFVISLLEDQEEKENRIVNPFFAFNARFKHLRFDGTYVCKSKFNVDRSKYLRGQIGVRELLFMPDGTVRAGIVRFTNINVTDESPSKIYDGRYHWNNGKIHCMFKFWNPAIPYMKKIYEHHRPLLNEGHCFPSKKDEVCYESLMIVEVVDGPECNLRVIRLEKWKLMGPQLRQSQFQSCQLTDEDTLELDRKFNKWPYYEGVAMNMRWKEQLAGNP